LHDRVLEEQKRVWSPLIALLRETMQICKELVYSKGHQMNNNSEL